MRIFAILVALIITSKTNYIFAQNINIVSIEKEADSYFKVGKYKSAEAKYLILDSINPQNTIYSYKLGICNLQKSHKKKALEYLLKAKINSDKCPQDLNYYLGRAYHYNYKFNEAWESYNLYKNYLVAEHLDNNTKIKDINRKMEVCKMAKEIVAKPLNVKISSVGNFVNSSESEYTPIITADEQKMYFTARYASNTGGLKDDFDEDFYEDIYVSEKSSIGWGVPKKLANHINTNNHDAVVGITDDGGQLIIYKHVHDQLSDSYSGNLFYTDLKGDQWTDPVPFDHYINSAYWEPSAHLSSDEKTMYFSSNRPGGFGGTDIYFSQKNEKGKWSKPVNMGPQINTPYDDDAPYLLLDGKTLYFSSMGHTNIGGHDIFVSVKDSLGNWSNPQNLGYPINTTDDDLYFSWSVDGTRIYFSSVREENGSTSSDIYVGEILKNSEHVLMLKGNIFDKLTKKPIEAKITTTDLFTGQIVSQHSSNELTGKYLISLPEGKNYRVEIEKKGYLFQSINLNIPSNKSYIELDKDFYLDSLVSGKETFLKNVFFEKESHVLNENSFEELDKIFDLLEANPTMSVEVIGNIDDILDTSHNKFLSESRATAILEYLTKKGIEENRIVAVGYTDDVVNNINIEERLEHFNPELHIVSNMNFNYNRDKLKFHSTNTVKRHKHGEPIVGTYLHESIYFPENESTILHRFSSEKIDEVLNLLIKFPNLKIRIEAHYDNNIDVKHNQHLAIAREKIVYNELIRLGADPKRIALTSYPNKVSGNLNVNHENTLKNRKIKFKVLAN